jgi:hypothetical protein
MVKEIKLTQGKLALVDDEDYEYLNQWKWYAHWMPSSKTYYAQRGVHLNKKIGGKWKTKRIKMHREIIGRILEENGEFELLKKFKENPGEYPADHINGDGLYNLRSNLRIVSARGNAQNKHNPRRSSYPGVSRDDRINQWIARITVNNKMKNLGGFKYELDAYCCYLKACEIVGSGDQKAIDKLMASAKYSSNYVGISLLKRYKNKWYAYADIDGKRINLGYYDSEYQAYLGREIYKRENGLKIE